MLKTNMDKLVELSVQGKVAKPYNRGMLLPDHEGNPFVLPGTGGITYNIKTGDNVFDLVGDHVEPCVSSCTDEKHRGDAENSGYNVYSCSGNEARIISGDAKGTKGVVLGHHGGIEHVIIEFPDSALKKMTLDDKILVHAVGQGLKFLDYPEIKVYNLSPALFKKMGITEDKKSGKIKVPVTHKVPGQLMGSGVGSLAIQKGDYDIMTQDKGMLEEHGLLSMRFGDIVAIMDHDNSYGRNWQTGAVTIGIVIHSDCVLSGHGPGVSTLITAKSPLIEPVVNKNANLGHYMKIGRFAKKTTKNRTTKKK